MTVVSALLWAAALVAALWILVPAIAFALNIGGLRTDIFPDAGPPTLYSEDSIFGPRISEFAAIGFRMESRTRERGWFISPIHWTWQAYEAQQWLVSPDGLTHATLYRLAEGEPTRISVVTTFEDGGCVRTYCPGAGAKETTRPDYWRFDVRGVDAAELCARHQEQVERFARERGTRAKAASVAEIAAADNAAEWPIVRKLSASSYFGVAMFAAVVLGMVIPMRGHMGSPLAPLGICMMAGLHALFRWWMLGPMLRQNAQLSHKHDLSDPAGLAQAVSDEAPKDIAADGRILATGKNERRLRLLAAVAAALLCAWPIGFARAVLHMSKDHLGAIIPGVLFSTLTLWYAGQFVGRARGRIVWTRRRDPVDLWQTMVLFNFIFMMFTSTSGHFRLFFLVVATLSFPLGFTGWALEKKRGE